MSLSLDSEYRSSGTGLVKEFFARVLPAATRYRRAVGFFNSSVFSVAPEAWAAFFTAGGEVQLVCSEHFSPQDVAALYSAIVDRPRWRRRAIGEVVSSGRHHNYHDMLSWLVANDRVIIKVAFLDPKSDRSLYHEKIGIFTDKEQHAVAISGSANESANAWQNNFERVDTFINWGTSDAKERCARIEQAFESLWRNGTSGVDVTALVDCILDGRLKSTDADGLPQSVYLQWHQAQAAAIPADAPPEVLVPPSDVRLFDHQRSALTAWGKSNGRGVLEMATGAGKTITALHLAARLYEAVGPGLAVVIVAPYIHLMDQWITVSRRYGLRPIRCAEGLSSWQAQLGAGIDALNVQRRGVLSVVTTAATLGSAAFIAQMSRIRRPFLFIGDEAHNYGAAHTATALPSNAQYRLGLSATPCRWMDPDGTQRLHDYFGPVVFQYGLADGIRDKILTPYRYYPSLVPFDEEEFEEYTEYTRLIRRYTRGDSDDGDVSEAAKTLLIKRARLVASARAKLPLLRSLLSARRDDDHILVYCGDGSVEGPNSDDMVRQVEAVTAMLGNDLGMRCASYTAQTPPTRRKELLEQFDEGFLQVLVAIRCLDEGVDIPSTRTAFILASSTNPRQFVQRRGRVLRRHASKARAEIYDLFVSPPDDTMVKGHPGYDVARALVRGQVHRAAEFASLAENGPIARGILTDLMAPLHLLDIWN